MKGSTTIIDTLNSRLSEELSAINQYITHAEMCKNWGYSKLHEFIESRAKAEMKHASMLIERILFLEGRPVVNVLKNIVIGDTVVAMHKNDVASEYGAIKAYNESISQAVSEDDNGSRTLFETILKDEELHADELESQLTQIEHMGIANYLEGQI